jgi:hypothetical protein
MRDHALQQFSEKTPEVTSCCEMAYDIVLLRHPDAKPSLVLVARQ